MPTVVANGIRLHYQSVGAGPDLVMVHGLAANLAFWYLQVVPLLKNRFRVTTYDLRGHGYSDMPLRGYTTADMAHDLSELLGRLGITQANVVGHSFGGAVALHFALLYPERVRTLVLPDARVHALQPLPKRGDQRYWNEWRRKLRRMGVHLPDNVPQVAYSLIEEVARERDSSPHPHPSPYITALERRADSPRAMSRWRALLEKTSALQDFSDPSGLTADNVREIDVPTLATYGEYSHCMPTGNRLAELLPRCTHMILPGVGHLHPVIRPVNFIDLLSRFVLCN